MLSKRMEAVVSMVSPQSFAVADVGCDHAYVSIALLERGIAKKVIAMDVRQGPLKIAAGNVKSANLEEKIDLRLSDGLEKLTSGEVDTIIIAGMGGLLVKRILEQGKAVLCTERPPVLVLQPQSDLAAVRIFLHSSAYHIVQETMLIEDGKYYTVMRAEPRVYKQIQDSYIDADGRTYWNVTEEENQTVEDNPTAENNLTVQYTWADWEYGRYNLEHGDKVLLSYLVKEQQQLLKIKESIRGNLPTDGENAVKTRARFEEVCQKLQDNKKILKQYYDYELQEG